MLSVADRLFPNCLQDLQSRGLLPPDFHAVLMAGSIVRGWGNASSDIDVYVITSEQWRSDTSTRHPVPLDPPLIAGEDTVVDDVRWDIRFWLESQIEQVLDKVTWHRYETTADAGSHLSAAEIMLLDRIGHAVAPGREEWLSRMRDRVSQSAFRSMIAAHRLNQADELIADAVGQLQAGDVISAVLSARNAFGHAVDALMAQHAECGHNTKWRARRYQSVSPAVLSFDEYWETETMRHFDPEEPAAWVLNVIDQCRKICLEVSV